VGSVRSDRQAIKAVRYVEKSFAARGHELTVVDPVEVQLPLLDRMYTEYEKGNARVCPISRRVTSDFSG